MKGSWIYLVGNEILQCFIDITRILNRYFKIGSEVSVNLRLAHIIVRLEILRY